MSSVPHPDTDQLLASAAQGDVQAGELLLNRHRSRLRNLVALRLDSRLAPRFDPSDVVQEALVTANQRLADYLDKRPIAFYPWLRQLTLNRLTDLYRHHARAAKRAVGREQPMSLGISDFSAERLADQLIDGSGSPSRQLRRAELKELVTSELAKLPDDQREIIVMRHLEELSVREIAEILDLPEGTVMSKHFRGIKALRRSLDE